jgi:tRNA A-37 threonylcarbamoyl transferase component Bud32
MTSSSVPDLSSPDPIPEGYQLRTVGAAKAIVWKTAAPWLDSVLSSGEGVHAWASEREGREEFPGRGRVFSVPAPAQGPSSAQRWAVRHYHRGGAMAMHMGDRYLRIGRPRPWRELTASAAARARGIPTPAVVCGVAYAQGRHYTADLVTEVVPDSVTLAETLLATDGTRGWLVAMSHAGALIRRLTEAGVFHVDLNARNILLTTTPTTEAFVIDLDRARVLRRASASAGDRMRARLIRSIVKIGTPTGEQLAVSEIEAALTEPLVES